MCTCSENGLLCHLNLIINLGLPFKYRPILFDYVTFVSTVVLAFIFLSITLMKETTMVERQVMQVNAAVIYSINMMFINSQWIKTFCLRFFSWQVVYLATTISRLWVDSEGPSLAESILIGVFTLIGETSAYTNTKAKLKLFIKIKESKHQQKQRQVLLDSIPDSVLICTKGTEDSAP